MPTLTDQLKKPNLLILDVRSPDECAAGDGYKGSRNIPINELPQRIAECGTDKLRPIICYCAAGMRATSAMKLLKERGFTDVIATSNAASIRAVRPDR